MAWLSVDEIRQKFNILANRFGTQIEAAISSAALIIQRSVEADVYAEAIDDSVPATEPELSRFKSILEAHSFLTMWFLVGNVGNRLSEAGFVKSQQDASSPAGSKTITNSYLTPKEIAEMRKNFLADAQFWIEPYGTILIEATPDVLSVPDPISTGVKVTADW